MKLTLIEKRKEAGDAFSFIFKPERESLWKPGQFMFYTLPTKNPDNRGVTRYFTISSAPYERHVMITTRISKKSSTFKKSLANLKIGDKIEASGPDGQFVVDAPKRNLIFIAGGIGITPFRSILVEYAHNKQNLNVQLLYANKDENIVFKDELESLLPRNPNFKIRHFIGEHIDKRTLSSIVNRKSSIINRFLFFISGPSSFVRSIRDTVQEQGVPRENIKLDLFPGYNTDS